ncbi:MAG: hypothetical protein PWP08_1790 [Methanofollis sp.]|nr:hypothetical protein [Methanofollis sp.]
MVTDPSPGGSPFACSPHERRKIPEIKTGAITVGPARKRPRNDAYMGLKFFLNDLFEKRVDLVDRDTIKPKIHAKFDQSESMLIASKDSAISLTSLTPKAVWTETRSISAAHEHM